VVNLEPACAVLLLIKKPEDKSFSNLFILIVCGHWQVFTSGLAASFVACGTEFGGSPADVRMEVLPLFISFGF
jgi:hypothetical protein